MDFLKEKHKISIKTKNKKVLCLFMNTYDTSTQSAKYYCIIDWNNFWKTCSHLLIIISFNTDFSFNIASLFYIYI